MAVNLSYGLTEPVIAAQVEARKPLTESDPLGAGIIRPFRRDGKGDFANGEGELLVRSDLGQLLGTTLGEVPWRSTLGTLIYQLRHKANTQALSDLARIQLENAIKQWEPRVQLISVKADPITIENANRIELKIQYKIGQTQVREDTAII